MKLYDRTISDDDDPDHIPADLVHHFLLAICSRPGTGLCFKDRGWYPREDENDGDEDSPTAKQGGRKIYNKILANVLKTLKVNEDLRQQELALKIMVACPELVAGFVYSPSPAILAELSIGIGLQQRSLWNPDCHRNGSLTFPSWDP